MFVRYVLLAVAAATFADVNGQSIGGPEDMHFPVVRSLENNIEKQLNASYVYTTILMKHAALLTHDKDTRVLVQQIIEYKSKNAQKLILYAGSRGLTPNPDPPTPTDLTKCADLAGCWSLSLDIERELYRALSNLHSTAGSHEDADMRAVAESLVRDEMRSIIQVKGHIASTQKY